VVVSFPDTFFTRGGLQNDVREINLDSNGFESCEEFQEPLQNSFEETPEKVSKV